MKHRIGMWLEFQTRDAGETGYPSFEAFLDEVMERLLELESVEDPSIGGSLTSGAVEIEVTVEHQGRAEDGVRAGLACIRTALHAAHAQTDPWPVLREGGVAADPVNQDRQGLPV